MREGAFSGRTALVTGASRGIGAATALELARQGAHVILTARTAGALEEVEEAIFAAGGSATIAPLDLTENDGIARLAEGLQFESRADDGLVEAARSLHHGFVLGVQWHPEWRVMETPFYHAIFRAFGQACRQHQQNRLDSR